LAIATIAIGNLGVYAATSLRLIAANIVIVSIGKLLLAFVIGGGYLLSIGFYYLLHSTVVTAALLKYRLGFYWLMMKKISWKCLL
jgi:multicomponent K+:H+ antiporter subunit D